MRRSSSVTGDDPFSVVMRLAVLLSGGASPALAWRHLAAGGDPTLRSVSAVADGGGDVAAVLRGAGGSWVDIAAVYAVAVETGAPLAETLRTVAVALREAAEISADVGVALAEPAATARLLAWLPIAGIPLGAALGFDTVGILLGDPVGRVCAAGGAALIVLSRIWCRRLVRSAQPPPGVPGLEAELWAVALSAGASPDRARRALGPRSETDEPSAVAETLELAARAGVPAAELLRAEGWAARHRARTAGREAAARLSTRLLLPLGACTLPAFLLLTVAPLVRGLLRSGFIP